MSQEICCSRQRAAACRCLLVAAAAASLSCVSSAFLCAQSYPMHGYITAVSPPNGFDVNGEHVITTGETLFGPINTKDPASNRPTRDAVEVGAWVEVYGAHDRKAKTVAAQRVLFRDDLERKLTGLVVIEKMTSTAPELVFAADGYRIHVTPATEVKFPHDVKSAADVKEGLWVLYEGKLGEDGLVVASKVRFLSTNHAKSKSEKAAGDSSEPPASGDPVAKDNAQPPNNVSGPAEDQIDDRRTDVQFSDNTYRISKDPALQSRVRRVGTRLAPVYQKELPEDDPSKIQFEFIAVNSPIREELASPEGLILVPAQLAARLKNDDQLAAVIADGIAYSLQQKAPLVIQFNRANLERSAVMGAASLIPYGGFAVSSVYTYEMEKALKEQRWRVALELMADAGYDPWQAPEAWRLAQPGKLPADTSTLKYPDRSGYQFGILNRMYKKPAPSNATEGGGVAQP